MATENSLGGTIGNDRDIVVRTSADAGATWTPAVPLYSEAAGDSWSDVWPEVETNGEGTWLVVWERITRQGLERFWNILVARSSDDGATWTAPQLLNVDATWDSGDDGCVEIAGDRRGHWIAVWCSSRTLGGTIGTDPDVLISHSFDDGVTWSEPTAFNPDASSDSIDDSLPRIATDGTGNWGVVWQTGVSPHYDVVAFFSNDDGATWGAPEVLGSDSETVAAWSPQLTTNGSGDWLATWNSNALSTDHDIMIARAFIEPQPPPTPVPGVGPASLFILAALLLGGGLRRSGIWAARPRVA
jgi:hypothetical protein